MLVSHWRDLLFVPYGQAQHHSIFIAAFYLLTGAGHQAVIVFFVLSGYLVTSAIVRAKDAQRWSWLDYLERRLARLWTVLVPALVLVAALDFLGMQEARSAPMYFGNHSENMLMNAAQGLNLPTFLGNIFFLQRIAVPTFGSDGALWSLSYEFWYYILFPLALFAVWGPAGWLRRAGLAVAFIALGMFVGRDILVLFPVWLMGSALNYLPRLRPRPVLLGCLSPLYFVVLLAKAPSHPAVLEYFTGAATFGMIWLALGLVTPAPRALWVRGSQWMASFSYSLYVVHSSLLVLLVGLWIGVDRSQVTAGMVLKASPLLLAAGIFAFGFAWCTEFHTDAVRRWLHSLHSRRSALGRHTG